MEMSVTVYCKKCDANHKLDNGQAAALIYTYQRTLAEVTFQPPIPVVEFSTEAKLLETFCPRYDTKRLETPKTRQFRRMMGVHRRRYSASLQRRAVGRNRANLVQRIPV